MPERNVASGLEEIQRSLQGLNLSNGYLYLDEIGQTKWQGKSYAQLRESKTNAHVIFRCNIRLSAAGPVDGCCCKQRGP
jgi:hypothetical protein